jgi:flagellar basal-body rod modification protein FlgD
MVDSVTQSANTTAIASSAQEKLTGAAKQMGKDDFLKLLVAQLQNQDPLKPQDNSTFVAELAQFSNLEQTVGINDRLDALSLQNQGLQNSNIVDMVGSTATVRGSTVTASGTGSPVPVSFSLDGAAESVRVTIKDLNGKEIRNFDIGKRPAGTVASQWDGRNDQGVVQPGGAYTVTVTATNAAGAKVSTQQETKGLVTAVSFDKGFPVLHLSTGISVPVGDLLRIEH